MTYSNEIPVDCLPLILYHYERLIESSLVFPPMSLLPLSRVSKRFYKFFTSDYCWSRYDVHGVECNVYDHFIETLSRSSPEAQVIMAKFGEDSPKYITEVMAQPMTILHALDLYFQLHILRMVGFGDLRQRGYFKGITDKRLYYCHAQLVGCSSFDMYYADPTLSEDLAFNIELVARNGHMMRAITRSMWDHPQVSRAAATGRLGLLNFIRKDHTDESESLIIEAIERAALDIPSPYADLRWLREYPKIYNNKALMLRLALLQPGLFQRVGDGWLQSDPDVVIRAVYASSNMLEHASKTLRDNKEVVKTAVFRDGMALKFASDALRADAEVVQLAVANDGRALEYAAEEFKANREIVELAIRSENGNAAQGGAGQALKYAIDDYKHDKQLVSLALRYNSLALADAAMELRDDLGFVCEKIKDRWRTTGSTPADIYKEASERVRSDRVLAHEVINMDPMCYRHVVGEAQSRDLLVKAINRDAGVLEFASEALKNDSVIAELVCTSRSLVGGFMFLSPDIRATTKYALKAVTCKGAIFSDVLPPAKLSRPVILAGVRSDIRIRYHIPKPLTMDKEFMAQVDSICADGCKCKQPCEHSFYLRGFLFERGRW